MLRFLTAGESHGRALVVIVEGLPAGLPIAVEAVQDELARRRLGLRARASHEVRAGRGHDHRRRPPRPHPRLAGGHRGRATASGSATRPSGSRRCRCGPRTGPPQAPLTQVRPGHADLAGMQKYGLTDARDVLERASARETAARVAAGTLAKALLAELDVDVLSHVIQMGAARSKAAARPGPGRPAPRSTSRPVRCFDAAAEEAMVAEIKAAAKDGDSLGGVVEVLAYGVPVGLGSHVHWDRKLDALLARALMSIQAVKGVEIGDGFEVAGRRGSEAHDPITWDADAGAYRRESALAGGIEGGMSTGEVLVARAAMKPLATLNRPDAQDRRHRHQGGGGVVQGAHRRHRGARAWASWPRRWWRSCWPTRPPASSGATRVDELRRNRDAFVATLG